jgi:CheY-like chemotaxis protein
VDRSASLCVIDDERRESGRFATLRAAVPMERRCPNSDELSNSVPPESAATCRFSRDDLAKSLRLRLSTVRYVSSSTGAEQREVDMNILLASCDDMTRAVAATALRNDGHTVNEAADGIELIGLLCDPGATPDLVVMDLLMPYCSGLGVLTALRRARSRLPVILMTGLRHGSILQYARALGVVTIFPKPFDLDDLRSAVAELESPFHSPLLRGREKVLRGVA